MSRPMDDAGAELASNVQLGIELIESACRRMTLAVIEQDWQHLCTVAKEVLPVFGSMIGASATLASTEPLLARLDKLKGGRPGEERG